VVEQLTSRILAASTQLKQLTFYRCPSRFVRCTAGSAPKYINRLIKSASCGGEGSKVAISVIVASRCRNVSLHGVVGLVVFAKKRQRGRVLVEETGIIGIAAPLSAQHALRFGKPVE